jgi:spore maturation protein CgeB
MAKLYNGTRIAINHNRTICGVDPDGIREAEHISPGEAYSLGPRTYEIAACGAFQLSDNSRKEMYDLFGDSIAVYNDADDLQAKVDYYLTHENERQEMADEAHARVQGCTYENRVRKVLLPFLKEVL